MPKAICGCISLRAKLKVNVNSCPDEHHTCNMQECFDAIYTDTRKSSFHQALFEEEVNPEYLILHWNVEFGTKVLKDLGVKSEFIA